MAGPRPESRQRPCHTRAQDGAGSERRTTGNSTKSGVCLGGAGSAPPCRPPAVLLRPPPAPPTGGRVGGSRWRVCGWLVPLGAPRVPPCGTWAAAPTVGLAPVLGGAGPAALGATPPESPGGIHTGKARTKPGYRPGPSPRGSPPPSARLVSTGGEGDTPPLDAASSPRGMETPGRDFFLSFCWPSAGCQPGAVEVLRKFAACFFPVILAVLLLILFFVSSPLHPPLIHR